MERLLRIILAKNITEHDNSLPRRNRFTTTTRSLIIGLCFLMACLSGCVGGKDRDIPATKPDAPMFIDLNQEESNDRFPLSAIADTVLFVPLETSPQSIFSSVRLIQLNDNYIVISDMKRLLVFKNTGEFVRQIGRTGKGPGEFGWIMNFILREDTLYITSTERYEVAKYTLDGTYQGSIRQAREMKYIHALQDGGYAWYDRARGNMIYFDERWQPTDTLRVENEVPEGRLVYSRSFPDDRYLFPFKDKLLFTDYRNDTIWNVAHKKKEPFIITNLGNKLLPFNLQAEFLQNGNRFEKEAQPYQRISLLMQTDSLVFISHRNWTGITRDSGFIVYNKNSHKAKWLKNGSFPDKMHAGLSNNIYYDNVIICPFPYEAVLGRYEHAATEESKLFWKKQLSKIKEEDNPTLVIIKLK